MDKEKDGLLKTALDWGKADFIKIRQDLAKVDWKQLLVGKSTAEWPNSAPMFYGLMEQWGGIHKKLGRVQVQHVP